MTLPLHRTVVAHALALVEPVVRARDEAAVAELAARAGWDLGPLSAVPGQLAAVVAGTEAAVEEVRRYLVEEGDDLVAVARSLGALAAPLRRMAELARGWQAPAGAPPELLALFVSDLSSALLEAHLVRALPRVHAALKVLGVLHHADAPEISVGGRVVRHAQPRPAIDTAALGRAITDPGALLMERLVAGGAAAEAADLAGPLLADALASAGLVTGYGTLHADDDPRLGEGERAAAAHLLRVAMLPLDTGEEGAVGPGEGDGAVLGATIGLADGPGGLGLVVVPTGELSMAAEVGAWDVTATVGGTGHPFVVDGDGVAFLGGPAEARLTASALATLRTEGDQPAARFGGPGGTRLEVGEVRGRVDLDVRPGAGGLALEAAAELRRVRLVVSAADTDGFLRTLLPAETAVDLDLVATWATGRGLALNGSAGLQVEVPVDRDVLGVGTVESVRLGLRATTGAGGALAGSPGAESPGAESAEAGGGGEAHLRLEVAFDARLALGPVKARVAGVGVLGTVRFPEGGGNLGPADLAVGFKPPDGLGLSLDAGAVTGAGFLGYDADQQAYAGGVDLELARLRLSAIGLLATRLPDGRPGFSLLLIVSVRFPNPVPLGFGFNLAAIGGLVGINRTVDVERVRAGLRSGSLSTVLSPGDVVGNQRRLLDDLGRLFPVTAGRHLFGPTATITWGVPTVVTLELALALELPQPLRFIAAGRVRMRLPDERAPVAVVNLDAFGVLDVGEGSLALDATIYDSHVAGWRISGDMALRARWTGQRQFVMSAGGFHPRFRPPAGFPALRRMALSIGNGSGGDGSAGNGSVGNGSVGDGSVGVRLAAYLALTSNTLQLGARAELRARSGDFTVAGHFGFDVLVRFSPFGFEVDLSLAIAVRWKGKLLLGITADVFLAGPGPWRVRGRATIKVLFLKATVRFKASFGSQVPLLPAPPQDVAALVRAALAEPGAWSVDDRAPLAALTVRSGIVLTELLVSPSARLSVRQKVAPVGGARLDHFGQAPVAGDRELRIEGARLAGVAAAVADVRDEFAPAQFFEMTDEEKLSRPAFDLLASGVAFTATEAISFDTAGPAPVAISYQTLVVDDPDAPARAVAPGGGADLAAGGQRAALDDVQGPGGAGGAVDADAVLGGDELDRLAHLGAAGRAATRASGLARFDAAGLDLRVLPEAFQVVASLTLQPEGPVPEAGERWSRSEAADRLRQWVAGHPESADLTVVPAHEVAAAEVSRW